MSVTSPVCLQLLPSWCTAANDAESDKFPRCSSVHIQAGPRKAIGPAEGTRIHRRAGPGAIQVLDDEFDIVRACTFMVDTERCCAGLVAISAISFFTMERPNEL
jgi:hypothetical protein